MYNIFPLLTSYIEKCFPSNCSTTILSGYSSIVLISLYTYVAAVDAFCAFSDPLSCIQIKILFIDAVELLNSWIIFSLNTWELKESKLVLLL